MSTYCMWIKRIAQKELLQHLQVTDTSVASDERDTCKRQGRRIRNFIKFPSKKIYIAI